MEEGKHRSGKEESSRKEGSRRGDREHNPFERGKDKEKERNRGKERDHERDGERHKDKVRNHDRHGEMERKSDDKYKEKHKDSLRKELESDGRASKRREEREREKEKERKREREEKEIIREKEERERAREKEREREREREEKERAREERKEKERAREEREEKERAREKEREHEREEREKAREKEREREREREEKERAREKEREREREREEKERAREERERQDGERAREREREDRERAREKPREREKRRESEDGDIEEREHERKRRRRDDEHVRERERERERERSRSERYREGSEDDGKRKKGDKEGEKKSKEEIMEEEQRRLDEEMDKRRRRVQEWQELRRKQEESEREKEGGEKAGKNWTLDGEESDDEEVIPDANADEMPKDLIVNEVDRTATGSTDPMEVDSENEKDKQVEQADDEEEIDPLDAFMNSMVLPQVEKLSSVTESSSVTNVKMDGGGKKAPKEVHSNGSELKKGNKKAMGRIIPGEESDSDYEDNIENTEAPSEDEDDEEFMKRVKKTKAEKLSIVDHSKIQYPPFRKNFYIEVKEILKMTQEEVSAHRKQLELKIYGKDVPKPVKTWNQTGLSTKMLEIIKKLNFDKPMPIQAQALPIIMSGRDCIGIAKTGSGKTLAFVLPMLRHIKDQPPVVAGDGPIGLIMAPTRELVQQIHGDIKKFSKGVGLNCVAVYGGSGVAQQISDLKRGAEIVVCTPGRMIDILCTSGGKITNLRRVTYLVMDEADRMFDMGFEPQITRIVQNTRPDRQTVLFSATFPRQVEILARKVLSKPVEIQVGGRSVVNKDITQRVEVRPEEEKFLRLLEMLGEEYEKGKILVFVHSQEKCDSLFKDLLRHGYPCLSLHGAKEQTDRESTISDFKSNVCNLLIATSVAARGLDVKELELVVNFDVPNHYEDYVHRVGRTGRAGRTGKAYTFISEDEARYAPDLVKALELSEQVVPDDLKALADGFMAKVTQGTEQAHGTGYGGSGFKFNEEEDEARKAVKKAQAREYGFEEDKSDSDSEDDGVRKAGADLSHAAAFAQVAALAAASKAAAITSAPLPVTTTPFLPNGGLPPALIPGLSTLPGTAGLCVLPNDAAARATALAAAMNLQHNLAKIQADAMPEHYEAELEINDFPQNCRWKVTHKETLGPISEWTGAAITTRGQYFPPGKIAGPGERKLYLFIEGPTESSVKKAKVELKRVLEDCTAQALSLPGAAQPGKYSVL